MKPLYFLILLFCFSINALAQKNKYPYTYHIKLPDTPSYCYTNDFEKPVIINKDSQLVRINFISVKDPYIFADCKLIIDNKDTINLFVDIHGNIEKIIPLGNFRLLVERGDFSKLDYYISPTTQLTNIKAVMGRSNTLTIPILHSKKPLEENEIIEIIKHIAEKGATRLIHTNTYYVGYEI